jgi:hypothetical protein
MSGTSPNDCYICKKNLIGQKYVWSCKKCGISWCNDHKKTHFRWNWLYGLSKEHCPNCKVLLKENMDVALEFIPRVATPIDGGIKKSSAKTRNKNSRPSREGKKPDSLSSPAQPRSISYKRTDANILTCLKNLAVVADEPKICRDYWKSNQDALLCDTLGPVNINDAKTRAERVLAMGDVQVTGDAVIVSFQGHAVADGVAIWRTGQDEYHMNVWYDHLD